MRVRQCKGRRGEVSEYLLRKMRRRRSTVNVKCDVKLREGKRRRTDIVVLECFPKNMHRKQCDLKECE